MLKSALKTLAVLACSLAYAVSAQAIEWHASSHKVLQGDYNGDGVTDFYLAARPLPMVLPLNGLTTLVVPRTQHSFVLQNDGSGKYTLIRPLDATRVAQVAWTPAPYSTLGGDYNGDGLPDLLLRPDASGQDGLLLTQNAAGVASLAQVLNSLQLGVELSTAGGYQLQWQDVNGDGKADLLMTKAGSSLELLAGVAGFSSARLHTPVQPPASVVSDQPLTASAGGLAEGAAEVSLDGTLTYSYPLTLPAGVNGLKPNLSIQYANSQADGYLGASWSLAGISAVSRCAEIPVRRSVQLDMNGDGNPDFVAPAADGRVYAYINKGGALSKDNFARIDLNLPTDIFADDAMRSTNEDYIPRPMDYDGDGRQDLLIIDKARNGYAVLRSRGQSFEKVNLNVPLMVAQEYLGVTGTPPQLPNINCTEWKNSKRAASLGYSPAEQQSNLGTTLLNVDAQCRYIPAGPLTRPEHSLVGDFNGDGQDDLLLVDQKGGEYVWHAYTQLRKRPELLSGITDSLGNQTQVSYGSITDPALYQGGAAVAFPEMNWRGPRDLVSNLKRSDGLGGLTESLYEYRDAKVNVLGRGFLGFATQITKEPARQRVLTRKFKQQFPLVGALTEESLEVKGKLLSRRTLDYLDVWQNDGKVRFVAPKRDIKGQSRF